ncbi:MAG: ABC transporter permease, partial [Micropruina sp.]
MKRLGLVVGVALVALVLAAALVSLLWTPFDPTQVLPRQRLLGPGWPHLLGTDGFGIDILSRILVGARSCLLVGVISVGIAAVIGVPLGILAGQAGGWISELVMR